MAVSVSTWLVFGCCDFAETRLPFRLPSYRLTLSESVAALPLHLALSGASHPRQRVTDRRKISRVLDGVLSRQLPWSVKLKK
jgi:hypothetical protein